MNNGLGKTLQIITLARYKKLHYGLKHCLIICGVNSLKWNWQREVEKFCKDEKAVVLGTRVNRNGRVVPTTTEETKQQIIDCPEEFFWIINIEKLRMSSEEKKTKTGIAHYLNQHIEDGNLGMIAIDEAHKCFDYNTLITTDIGNLKIGDIVENKIKCNILSYNTKTNKLEYEPILNYYKNVTINSKCLQISTSFNSFICTSSHKVYTLNKGWVQADELEIGDEVIELCD